MIVQWVVLVPAIRNNSFVVDMRWHIDKCLEFAYHLHGIATEIVNYGTFISALQFLF